VHVFGRQIINKTGLHVSRLLQWVSVTSTSATVATKYETFRSTAEGRFNLRAAQNRTEACLSGTAAVLTLAIRKM
jgi:hypothetical protein